MHILIGFIDVYIVGKFLYIKNTMRLKKLELTFTLLFCGVVRIGNGFAQEGVDSAELRQAGEAIEFVSNTAAPSVINTREDIWNIGASLGSAAKAGAVRAGDAGRYFVIHQLHGAEADKLDADVFGLGPGSAVDTIVNLRLIIQGYLEAAYGYAPADAALLSRYATVYNAVYRANRAYFTARYKSPILGFLSEGSEGLALRFDQWPGRTLMLIPLTTAVPGLQSAVDTSSIGDGRVVEELRKDEGRGVEDRRAMVDFKEKEAEEAGKAADEQKKANAAEQAGIQQEEQRINAEKERVAAGQAAVEQQKREAEGPEEKAAVAEKEAELAESARQTRQDEEALAERKEALEEGRQKEAALEAFSERKGEEAQAERASIAADQSEAITGRAPAATPAAAPAGVIGVRLAEASPRGVVVRVDPASGGVLRTSSITQVLARSYMVVGGRHFALAGAGNAARLVEIDPQTLETVNVGEDEMNGDTLLWASGNNLYAIVARAGKNYLALFDAKLQMQAQSARELHPWASVVFQVDRIVTQGADGTVVLLKAADLTE
ncbi:MAG: hypothetical protein LBS82_04160 [Spirochaetaceae bacterium]|nr:hypothetical protein [Spirochaetaceae bacterium]